MSPLHQMQLLFLSPKTWGALLCAGLVSHLCACLRCESISSPPGAPLTLGSHAAPARPWRERLALGGGVTVARPT